MILVALLATQLSAPPSAALGDVLWLLHKPAVADGGPSLCVMNTESDTFVPLRMMTGTPMAMAASGLTAWVAPPARSRGGVVVLGLRANWEPQLETWLPHPSSGMDRLPAVDLDGGLGALIGSTRGPIVIEGGDGARRVLALRRGQWQPLPDLPVHGEVLAAVEAAGVLLVLSKGQTPAIWRLKDGAAAWTETTLELEGQPHDLLSLDAGVLVGSQRADDVRVIGFLQDDAVVPWTQIDDVPSDALLLGSGENLCLYRLRDGLPWRSRVDRTSGQAGPWVPLEPTSGLGTRAWSIVIAVFIGLAVVFVLFIGRAAKPTQIPEGLTAAPLIRRVLAFGIDLVPGILLCVLLMDVTASDMLSAAITGPMPSTAILLLVLAAVTAAWGMLWEAACRRATPGKRAMRLITASTRSGPIRLWQILVRNLLRGLIVLAPPIAIIVLLTPAGQGLGDVAAGTMVLVRCETD